MDVEDFKKKYEQLKDNPMYKNFCSILDTKSQVLERTAKENQQLKEQLERSEKARKEAIKLVKNNQRKDEFVELNEWQARDLISILEMEG